MEKPIIIQAALYSEMNYLLEKFTVEKENYVGDFLFYECSYKGKRVIISKTKMGEVTSAVATTLGIMTYEPLFIINQGTAGASTVKLNKNDIVIGESVSYICALSTTADRNEDRTNPWKSEEYLNLDGERISYKADKRLIDMLKDFSCLKRDGIYFDVVGSGDIWTKDRETIEKYNRENKMVCEAMECTGAYFAANTLGVPLVSVRVISNNELKGQEYDPETDVNAQKAVLSILDEFLSNEEYGKIFSADV